MGPETVQSCTAFAGTSMIASGPVAEVARAVKLHCDSDANATVLVFDDESAYPVELDLRGSVEDVVRRLPSSTDTDTERPDAPRRPGRPKLGVVAREVTLLPRHWEWLATQPGGASAALRRLVEEARRADADADRARNARDVAYRFMIAVGGDLPDFEEVSRALFAGDAKRFGELTEEWPADVRDHAARLAAPGLE